MHLVFIPVLWFLQYLLIILTEMTHLLGIIIYISIIIYVRLLRFGFVELNTVVENLN